MRFTSFSCSQLTGNLTRLNTFGLFTMNNLDETDPQEPGTSRSATGDYGAFLFVISVVM